VTPSIRRHRAEQAGSGAQHSDVGQAVPAHRRRHREIQHDLRWVVARVRAPPARQRIGEFQIERDRADGRATSHLGGRSHVEAPG
jgi:hypothetical protein